ncbi:DNA repair protein complementing XP-C cells homolog isoform X2 [Dreissena polymorpha]|nr:DNA repair protein complementing XP-C cells homolog isoform X2 [Dreissena polymorpha]
MAKRKRKTLNTESADDCLKKAADDSIKKKRQNTQVSKQKNGQLNRSEYFNEKMAKDRKKVQKSETSISKKLRKFSSEMKKADNESADEKIWNDSELQAGKDTEKKDIEVKRRGKHKRSNMGNEAEAVIKPKKSRKAKEPKLITNPQNVPKSRGKRKLDSAKSSNEKNDPSETTVDFSKEQEVSLINKASESCKNKANNIFNKNRYSEVDPEGNCIDHSAEEDIESDDDFDEVDDNMHNPRNLDQKISPKFNRALPKTVDHMDAMAVLLHMEGMGDSKPSTSRNSSGASDDDELDEDESEAEWEDVQDMHSGSPKKSQAQSGSVEITLEAPVLYKKKKKKGFDLESYFKRQINKFKREVAMDTHKVHLLCLLARCQHLNSLMLEDIVRAQAFSVVIATKELQFPGAAKCSEMQVTRALVYISKNKTHLMEIFERTIESVSSQIRLVMVCVALLREVGLLTRLVMSLQPLTFKDPSTKAKPAKKVSTATTESKKKVAETSTSKKKTADGKKTPPAQKKKRRKKTETSSSEMSADSDFEEDSILENSKKLKRKAPVSKNRRVLSTDNELEDNERSDHWIEVFLDKEKKWICIDGEDLTVRKPYELENKATKPLCYVIGITQACHIKDITARYAGQWLTETRKLRTDPGWWEETLRPYACADRRTDEAEDRDMAASLQQQPLPTSVGALKNHPLYILQRHLLKFEAIYPDTAIPVGYIRGEPIYARECVHVLHSRENWLKEGRSVRLGEEPYKFVKSRPKWNKPKEDPEANDLELFGKWQTEVYIPPPAVDGKVPRNAHGNVEMFLPTMLPAGTVHLKIPGLNKVAKKLDIDCAPAMVGWDHHCGFSHPLMDGWIVCEEFKDILLAAWDEEQEILREKEAEKREKRVYDNWRKLIRGLLIRERLKKRFDLQEAPKSEDTKQPESSGTASSDDTSRKTEQSGTTEDGTNAGDKVLVATKDTKMSWPQNRLHTENHTLCMVEKL